MQVSPLYIPHSTKVASSGLISLIGMAAAGKTTIGKELAKLIEWSQMDSDNLIESTYGASLQTIADHMSKDAFLDIEDKIIQQIAIKRAIVSTGGSAVYREGAMCHLLSRGPVIYIDVPLPIILERIARKPERGLAIAPGQTIEDLYNERTELYKKYASFTIQGGNSAAVHYAQEIAEWLVKPGFMNTLFADLATLYNNIQHVYQQRANHAGLDCTGCTDNCCVSYFQHHTYIEWAYLWKGIRSLDPRQRLRLIEKAKKYQEHVQQAKTKGVLPSLLCPVNENGMCSLYQYRLMICRLHGTRNSMTLPDGQIRVFQGCQKFVSLPKVQSALEQQHLDEITLDRTPFYRMLADLEMKLLQKYPKNLTRCRHTIAEMIVLGPPCLS